MRTFLIFCLLFASCGGKKIHRTGPRQNLPSPPQGTSSIIPNPEKIPGLKEECLKELFVIWHKNQCQPLHEFKRFFPKSISSKDIEMGKLSEIYQKYISTYLFLEGIGYRGVLVPEKMIIQNLDPEGEFSSYLSLDGKTLIADPGNFNVGDFEGQLITFPMYNLDTKMYFMAENKATILEIEKVKQLILKFKNQTAATTEPYFLRITTQPLPTKFFINKVNGKIHITLDSRNIELDDLVAIFEKLGNGDAR